MGPAKKNTADSTGKVKAVDQGLLAAIVEENEEIENDDTEHPGEEQLHHI